jgi:4-amino-4-deoxychorismate lyase
VATLAIEERFMHQRIIYNGRLMDAAGAKVSAVSPATLYGHGVFTTLAIFYGRPFLWDLHWSRLIQHAERSRIDCQSLLEDDVLDSLKRLIETNSVHSGRARITLLARKVSGPWNLKGMASEGADLLIMTGDSRAVPDEGLALTISPYRVSTLAALSGVKSVNYLDNILAWEEARERDFEEAVSFNERGEVVSATRANIFWVTKGQIHTPALTTGALAGTTRAHVLQLASELSIPHIEGVYDLADLADADEIFLTSAGLGITHVHIFDYRSYRLAAGSIVVRLREAFHQSTLKFEEN